jgi:hypothetical protein
VSGSLSKQSCADENIKPISVNPNNLRPLRAIKKQPLTEGKI